MIQDMSYEEILVFYFNRYKQESGEEKFNKIFERVQTSNKISGLLSKSRFHNVYFTSKTIMLCVLDIPYFTFSSSKTKALAALLALKRWNDEVKSSLLLLEDNDLKEYILEILNELKPSFENPSSLTIPLIHKEGIYLFAHRGKNKKGEYSEISILLFFLETENNLYIETMEGFLDLNSIALKELITGLRNNKWESKEISQYTFENGVFETIYYEENLTIYLSGSLKEVGFMLKIEGEYFDYLNAKFVKETMFENVLFKYLHYD